MPKAKYGVLKKLESGLKKTWYCGVNYIPANAINYTAMWDKTSFSPDVIDREMQLMKELGMNCARVVMQYAVYEDDPAYFLRTLDTFLGICDKYGVKVMPIFLTTVLWGQHRSSSRTTARATERMVCMGLVTVTGLFDGSG